MAAYRNFILTNQGISLLGDLMNGGGSLEFRYLAVGSGDYGDRWDNVDEMRGMEELKEERQRVPFSSISKAEDGFVNLKASVTNEGLKEGYQMTETGIYAGKKGEEGEILYCISTVENPDYMPDFSSKQIYTVIYKMVINIGDAENATIIYRTDVYALAEDLHIETARAYAAEDALKKQLGEEATRAEEAESALKKQLEEETDRGKKAEGELKQQLGEEIDRAKEAEMELQDRKLDKDGDASNVTTTFTQAESRANLTTKEKQSVSMGKIMKWFDDLANGAASTLLGSNLTANRAVVSNGSGKLAASSVTSTELGYLAGAKSKIQTQIDTVKTGLEGKLDKSGGTIAGDDLIINGFEATKGLRIRRNGSDHESTFFRVTDSGLVVDNTQDEAASSILFNLIFTDTEKNGGANAGQNQVMMYGDKKGSSLHATMLYEDGVLLANKYLGKFDKAARADWSNKIALPRTEDGIDCNNLRNDLYQEMIVTEISGKTCKNSPPYGSDINPWFHIFTTVGGDTRYAVQFALGMTLDCIWYRRCDSNVWGEWMKVWEKDTPKTAITWTTAGVSLTPGSETFSWYMVKNGWCFFQITCTVAAVSTQYPINCYLPKPMCGNYAYFRMNNGCVRVDASGGIRVWAEAENTNKIVQVCGSYPIL